MPGMMIMSWTGQEKALEAFIKLHVKQVNETISCT